MRARRQGREEKLERKGWILGQKSVGVKRQFEWRKVRMKKFADWNPESVAVFNCPGTFSFPVFSRAQLDMPK